MKFFYPIIILLIAVAGNFFLQKIFRWMEGDVLGFEAEQMRYPSCNKSLAKIQQDLNQFSIPSSSPVSGVFHKCHPQVKEFFDKIEMVKFDDCTHVFDRKIADHPFKWNKHFIQIGNRGDGSEILLKLDVEDPTIYIADIEHGDSEAPTPYSSNLLNYLAVCYEDSGNQ